MNKRKAWIGATLVFICGLIVGVLATGIFIKQFISNKINSGQGQNLLLDLVQEHVAGELSLNTEQSKVLNSVIYDGWAGLRQRKIVIQPMINQIVNKEVKILQNSLNPEQSKKLDDMLLERIYRSRPAELVGLFKAGSLSLQEIHEVELILSEVFVNEEYDSSNDYKKNRIELLSRSLPKIKELLDSERAKKLEDYYKSLS